MGWEVNNVQGSGDKPPPCTNTYKGKLILMGGGACVWSDIRALEAILPRDKAHHAAVNDIGQYWHFELTHWFTLHPGYMTGWRTFREGHGYGRGRPVWTHSFQTVASNRYKNIDFYWDMSFGSGTSTMFGIFCAFAMGYTQIILCGAPMDNSGHFFDDPDLRCPEFEGPAEKMSWNLEKNRLFKGRVRSMSGNTARWLGVPDKGWLGV